VFAACTILNVPFRCIPETKRHTSTGPRHQLRDPQTCRLLFLSSTTIDNIRKWRTFATVDNRASSFVDDEESIRRFAERTLRGAGYEVVLASDGPEALRIVDAQAVRFDLFVSDLTMPQIRGDELARQLRQRDPDAKVLYLTGYSDRLFAERHVL
jgi:hypothetical protein